MNSSLIDNTNPSFDSRDIITRANDTVTNKAP